MDLEMMGVIPGNYVFCYYDDSAVNQIYVCFIFHGTYIKKYRSNIRLIHQKEIILRDDFKE